MRRRGTGWLPDRLDDREPLLYGARLLPEAAPAVASDITRLMPAVLDQGDDNSCVAQAVAALVYAAHRRARSDREPELLSRKALWWLCRHETGSDKWNAGTQLRLAFRLMNRLGFCREQHWPHSSPLVKRPSVADAQRMCIDQRDTGARVDYRRVTETGPVLLHAIRCAICADLPVAFGVDVGEAFMRGDFHPAAALEPPAEDEDTLGHALVVCGYHDDDFLVQNSWGTGWGDGGRAWLSSAYMITARDPWTVVEAPRYSDEVPS